MSTTRAFRRGLIAALTVMLMAGCLVLATPARVHATGGSSFSSAVNIPLGGTDTDNNFGKSDRYFKFRTSGRDSYYVTKMTNGTNNAIDFYLYDSNYSQVKYTIMFAYETRSISLKLDKNSTYYVKATKGFNGNVGKLTVSVTELPDDAGDNFATANIISESVSGTLEISADEDWYIFTAAEKGDYRITGSNLSSAGPIIWKVYDENVSCLETHYTSSCSSSYYDISLAKGDVIYVSIEQYSWYDNSTYKLTIKNKNSKKSSGSLSPAKPKITRAKAGKKKATVTWNECSGATRYQIRFKKKGSAKWNIKNVNGTKAVLKGLKKGKKYSIGVRSVRTRGSKDHYSKWSKTMTVKAK